MKKKKNPENTRYCIAVNLRNNPPSFAMCGSPVKSFQFLEYRKKNRTIKFLTKKVQKSTQFLWQLHSVMVQFYTTIIESVMAFFITIWYAASTAKDKSTLHRIFCFADRLIVYSLKTH